MNSDDARIRKMFEELKSEDESNAPNFIDDWNVSVSRTGKSGRRLYAWQMSAVAAATLILLGTGWWIFVNRSTMQVAPLEIVTVDTSAPDNLPPVVPPPSSPITPPNFDLTVPKTAPQVSPTRAGGKNSLSIEPRQRPVQRRQRPTTLISQWRSPTEFLLRIPGGPLLKIVPRLDDSVVKIKTTISNQKN